MPTLTCQAVIPGRGTCGRPAKARLTGNTPVCGIHTRAAEQRGEETRPLYGPTDGPGPHRR